MGGGRGPGYLLDQRKRETAAEPEGLERASRNTSEHTPASEAWAAVMPQAATAELPRSTAALRGRRRPAVELFNINFGPNSRALVLAEILNVVQVFTTAHAVTVVTIVTVVQRSASRKWQKTRVKPENTWGVSRVFLGITRTGRWRSSWVTARAFLIVVQPA